VAKDSSENLSPLRGFAAPVITSTPLRAWLHSDGPPGLNPWNAKANLITTRIITNVDEILSHALKLLRGRDYTVVQLREKLTTKFGDVPQDVLDHLLKKNFLNDRRFAENYVARRQDRGAALLREELAARGVASPLIDEILSRADWPSLQEALAARMSDWKLRAPLRPRDGARLFRALLRLGYEEDAIREEIQNLRER
jgi:SOS response regulatory protein OraA/RecX